MNQPKSLLIFKKITQGFYFTYYMANAGMSYTADYLVAMEGSTPTGKFQIGEKNKKSDCQTIVAELSNNNAVKGMQKDGPVAK